jgi:hypothetical protein
MTRTKPDEKVRKLVEQLLAYEAVRCDPSEASRPAGFRIIEKLRRRLIRLAGTAGFRALLGRAVALARAEAPVLASLEVEPDGSLSDLHGPATQEELAEAGRVVIVQLLGLLVAFIGAGLTLSIVLDVWPELPPSAIELWRNHHEDPAR